MRAPNLSISPSNCAAGERQVEVLGPVLIGRDERQVDVGLDVARKFLLGLLGGFLEALQGHRVVAKVDALLLFELSGEPVDDLFVEVVAAQVGVAGDAEHFEERLVAVLVDVEDRHVERAAPEVEDKDLAALLLVRAECERSRGRLREHAKDLEAGDFAGLLRGLTLGVVEVRRHGNYGLGDVFAEVIFGRLLEVAEDEGRDLFGCELFVPHLHFDVLVLTADDFVRDGLLFRLDFAVPSAHEALDAEDGVLGVGHLLVTCRFTDEAFALVGEGDDRGRDSVAAGVDENLGLVALHDADHAVGRAQVDADDLGHKSLCFRVCCRPRRGRRRVAGEVADVRRDCMNKTRAAA